MADGAGVGTGAVPQGCRGSLASEVVRADEAMRLCRGTRPPAGAHLGHVEACNVGHQKGDLQAGRQAGDRGEVD